MTRPLSQMPGDLKRRVEKIETAIERDKRYTMRAAAQAAKEAQLDVMKSDAGGDLTLSRVRSGRGARIGASYSVGPTSATVKATGPVPLLANQIKPHRIPRPGARRRKVLAIPGVGVRASANHPGTRGKDTWNRGRDRAQPRATAVVLRRTDAVVTRAFRSGG